MEELLIMPAEDNSCGTNLGTISIATAATVAVAGMVAYFWPKESKKKKSTTKKKKTKSRKKRSNKEQE